MAALELAPFVTSPRPWRYPSIRATETQNALIALVNVPYGETTGSLRPLGLAALGAFLMARGINATGFDFSDSRREPEDLVEHFGLAKFPVVGLSFYNSNATKAFRLARAIKRHRPSCLIIAGGPHASATHTTICRAHPEIDIVVRNEGEETLLALMQALQAGEPLDGLAGISGHFLGEGRTHADRERVNDLDSLPAPVFPFVRESPEAPALFYDRAERRLKRATALVTSRSCPFRCSFCAIILIGRKWRKMSSERIISDLEALERDAGTVFEHIYFLDANFFVDYRRSLAIARALNTYRPGITFSFSTRVNQLLHGRSALPELVANGLRAVELGIESGSDSALLRFTKDVTSAQNEQAIALLREHGVQLFLDFIMFDAEATLDDVAANLAFLERNGLDTYVPWDHLFSYMTPYLGTAIRDHYERTLGIQLQVDELPDPQNLLLDPTVRQIFNEFWRLRTFIPRLAEAVQQLERRLTDPWSIEIARAKLNAVAFRRLPFLALSSLVHQARAGETPTLQRAIPQLHDDRHRSRRLDEVLDYALH
jgi:radical SAM superfamily enzyme YgiQ (UPF0313 family)